MSNPIAALTDTEPRVIRRADLEDAPACAEIVDMWLTAATFIQAVPPSLDELIDGFRKGIPLFHIWVTGSPIEGYLSFDQDDALIRGFYTARPGSGVGKRLLDHVKTDRDWLQLWTHEPNRRAHTFYEREGFVFSGQTRDGDDGPLELHMTWTRSQS